MQAGTVPKNGPLAHAATAIQHRIDTFVAQEPSTLRAAAQMNEGEAIERDLAALHDQATKAGCTGLGPKPDAPPSVASMFANVFSGLTDALPVILLLVVVTQFRGGRGR